MYCAQCYIPMPKAVLRANAPEFIPEEVKEQDEVPRRRCFSWSESPIKYTHSPFAWNDLRDRINKGSELYITPSSLQSGSLNSLLRVHVGKIPFRWLRPEFNSVDGSAAWSTCFRVDLQNAYEYDAFLERYNIWIASKSICIKMLPNLILDFNFKRVPMYVFGSLMIK